MLAAGAHAFLRGHGPRGKRGLGAGEDVLERHHAGIDEQKRRIVLRHQRRGRPAGMPLFLEIGEKGFADLVYAGHMISGSSAYDFVPKRRIRRGPLRAI